MSPRKIDCEERRNRYDPATGQFLTVDPLPDATRQPYGAIALGGLAGAISGWMSMHQEQRDNWYGYDRDQDFVNWVHRRGKDVENVKRDIDDRSNMKDSYEQRVDLGKPKLK